MKFFKALLSILLAIIMVFSCSLVALGTEEKENYPQIHVAGFGDGSVKIYYEDDPEQKSLFYPFVADRFIKNIGNVGKYMAESIKNKQPNVMRTIVYNYLMDCFGMLALTPDGKNMEGVVSDPSGLRDDGDNKYTFFYDCRFSPVFTAGQLLECINQVLEETGSEKVEIIGSSHGANIVTAFMYQYPEELYKIDTILECVPSTGGVRFVSELFSGNFDVNPLVFCDLVHNLAGEGIIPDFLYLMEEADILDIFLEALFVPVFRKAIFEGVLDAAREFLVTLPIVWVSVTDEHFESSLKSLCGENYLDPDHPYADLIADMIDYHYNIANKATEIHIKAAEENEGLNIAVITKFGYAGVPLAAGENTMEDGFVTVPVASYGATCTTYSAQLPADYKQQKHTEYNLMSPEWNIDASTGAFPFSTWYIKNIQHSERPGAYQRFVQDIVADDLDIFSRSDRPQYLNYDKETDTLEPLKAKDEKAETLYQKIWKFYRAIVLFPKRFFDKIFNK